MKPALPVLLILAVLATRADSWTEFHGELQESQQPPAEIGDSPARSVLVEHLQACAAVVGEWRGVGQPRRGSRVGAWTEKASGAWQFSDTDAAIVLTSDEARQFREIRFRWNAKQDGLTAEIQTTEDTTVACRRVAELSTDDVDVFCDADTIAAAKHRLTFRRISEIRVTLLFETRASPDAAWRRVAEIGYTRAGERLAGAGTGERQCVVTGGLGTMAVMHQGRTYYVCCEGCRQAFEADPEGTLAAYRERIAAPHPQQP